MNDLVAGGASRLDGLGVMTSAVQPALGRWRHPAVVDVEVDEIDEKIAADAADEALRVPVTGRTGTRRAH